MLGPIVAAPFSSVRLAALSASRSDERRRIVERREKTAVEDRFHRGLGDPT
jgi:hypothetical protein